MGHDCGAFDRVVHCSAVCIFGRLCAQMADNGRGMPGYDRRSRKMCLYAMAVLQAQMGQQRDDIAGLF